MPTDSMALALMSLAALVLFLGKSSADVALLSENLLFYADRRDVNRTQSDSESFCASIGGTVPSAQSPAELAFLREFLPHQRVTWCYRLTGKRVDDGKFYWTDESGDAFDGDWDEGELNHCIGDCRLCLWKNGRFVVSDASRHANAVCRVELNSENSDILRRELTAFHPKDRSFLIQLLDARSAQQQLKQAREERQRDQYMRRQSEKKMRDLDSLISDQGKVIRRMSKFMDTLYEMLPASARVALS